MGVLHLLSSENFITYSKVVAKIYGVNAAVLLGALCSYQNAYGEDFFVEQNRMSDDTCLSVYEIQQALKILKEQGIVSVTKKGLPARNYYTVVEVKLSKILTTSDKEIRPLEVKKLDNINKNKDNKNTNTNKEEKENTIKEKSEQKKVNRFVKPTIDEIRAYCEERGNGIDAEYFYAHYESKGWVVGKSPMKNWKMAIITWEKNNKQHNISGYSNGALKGYSYSNGINTNKKGEDDGKLEGGIVQSGKYGKWV